MGATWLQESFVAASNRRATDHRRSPPCSEAVMATSAPQQAAQKLPKTGSPPCACQLTTVIPAGTASVNNVHCIVASILRTF